MVLNVIYITLSREIYELLNNFCALINPRAGLSSRAVYGVGLRPFDCWNSEFDSHRSHGRLSVVSVVCVCCQVEVSVTS